MKRKYGGFGLIEVMLVLVIGAVIYYILINSYFKKPPVDRETKKALSESGVDASSPDTILKSARKVIKEAGEKGSADWENN